MKSQGTINLIIKSLEESVLISKTYVFREVVDLLNDLMGELAQANKEIDRLNKLVKKETK